MPLEQRILEYQMRSRYLFRKVLLFVVLLSTVMSAQKLEYERHEPLEYTRRELYVQQPPGSATGVKVNAPPPVASGGWTAPKGIPDPPVAVFPSRSLPSQPANWPSAQATGSYFINNTGTCSDAQTYGYPANPRCTWPSGNLTLAAGSWIYAVGGGADYTLTSNRVYTVNGTEESPVVIYGEDLPVLFASAAADRTLDLTAQYLIIDGIDFPGIRVGSATNTANDYILIRNSVFRDMEQNALGFGHSSTGTPSFYNEYIVYYNLLIHDIGPMSTGLELDRIGITMGRGTSYQWAVDNTIYNIGGGDCIRTGTNPPNNEPTAHLYIGRNLCHDTEENFLDVKVSNYVVASENTAYNFIVNAASAAGEAMVVHYGATHLSFIFNNIHDARNGWVGTEQSDVIFIGNRFWNIGPYASEGAEPNYTTSTSSAFAAIHNGGTSGECYYVNNTFFNNGIHYRNEGANACTGQNNIFGKVRTSTGHALEFEQSGGHTTAVETYGLFDTSSPGAAVQIGDTGATRYATSTAWRTAQSTKCASCIDGLPVFVSEVTPDFNLQTTSGAKDVGSATTTAYELHATWFGVPIVYDAAGFSRPQNSLWDIGAYEFR
jgi:hypothetical protein